MPSSSPQQHRLMTAVAANPELAKKVGIPQNVGKEFVAADAAKGTGMKTKLPPSAKGKKPPFMGKETKAEEAKEMKMAKGGKAKCYAKGGGIEAKGKTKGRIC